MQTSHGAQAPAPSNAFYPQKVSLREATNSDWVDKVEDWSAFWEDDYMTYEELELDDTHDALTMGKICQIHCTDFNHLM